jgi:cephalosporin-C deacetylase-like acetyl esterase
MKMSAITEWLKERGLDLKTIEIMDVSLKGTRQTRIHEWGAAPRNYQIRLTDFKDGRV